jgi:hypothetical protein
MSNAPTPIAFTSKSQLEAMKDNPGGNHVMWGEPLPHHNDIPLYAEQDVSSLRGQLRLMSMTATGAEKEADEAYEKIREFKEILSEFSGAYDDGMELYAASVLRDWLRHNTDAETPSDRVQVPTSIRCHPEPVLYRGKAAGTIISVSTYRGQPEKIKDRWEPLYRELGGSNAD